MAHTIDICVEHVKRAAGLSDEEAQKIVDRIVKRMKDPRLTGGEAADVAAIAKGLAEKTRLEAARTRQITAKNIAKRHRMRSRIIEHVSEGLRFDEAFMAELVGTAHGVTGGRDSISSRRLAIQGKYTGPIVQWLGLNPEIKRLLTSPRYLLSDERRAFLADVVREMYEIHPEGRPGITGNDKARDLAKIMADQTEALRVALNNEGANIGKLGGWTPQAHDGRKLIKAGFETWRNDVLARIDIERTFPYLFDPDFDPADWRHFNIPEDASVEEARDIIINRIMREIYDNITLGRVRRPAAADSGAYVGPGSLANKMGHHRVLHFKNADAWLDYHANYGFGNVLSSVISHIERESRYLALMERLGSNPEVSLRMLLDEFTDAIEETPGLSQAEKARLKQRLRTDLQRRRGKIAYAFAELMGETMVAFNPTFARVASGIRAMASLAKLGMATISSFADIPIAARNLKHNGRSIGQAWVDVVKALGNGRSSRERRQITYLFDTFLDGVLGSVHSRFELADGIPGAMSTAQNVFHRLSFLTQWTDNIKAGVVSAHAAQLAMLGDKRFGALPEQLRHIFNVHRITPEKWDIIRKAAATAEDGRRYVIPEVIADMPLATFEPLVADDLAKLREKLKIQEPLPLKAGEKDVLTERMARYLQERDRLLRRAREQLELDLLGYYADEAEFAVIGASDRSRAFMTKGTQPGTLAGEMLRFVWQFKSFPVNYVERVWGRAIYGWKHRSIKGAISDPRVVGDLAFLIAATTAFGFASMTAKDILKGRKPRDPTKWNTWTAAFVQGGGAGIYGDFLMGRYNRFGGSLPETLVGPVAGGMGRDIATLWADLLEGKLRAGKVLYKLVNNAPFVNLWYTRTALDYLVLYHLQEFMSPGILRRRERRIRREYNQEYIIPPSQVIARGGGFR